MPNPDSIEHVQDAEAKAKKIVEDAEKRRADKVHKASEKATQMVDDAEAKTKLIKEEAEKKALAEAEKERSKKLSQASLAAKKVQKKELGADKVKGIVDKVIRQIFG